MNSEEYMVYEKDRKKRIFKMARWGVIGFVVLLLLLNSFGTVGAGNRGIKLRFSGVTDTVYGEGLYFKLPFVERVIEVPVQIQKEEAQASAASKDLQTVTAKVAVNYHLDATQVGKIYQEVREDYKVRLIQPALQESVKATTAKFTAEELITKRQDVRDQMGVVIQEKLKERGIIVDQFNVIDFDFSSSFNQAIEAKVTAEQNALAAKNKLEQVKYEAQQGIEAAKGKAEAIRIESIALQDNPQVLELRALERWDGVLPQVTSGAIPFINITK